MPRRNRRKSKRFDLDFPACRTEPDLPGHFVVKDLSTTGAQILHTDPPPVGTELTIFFDHGKLEGHRARGRVVRHNKRRDSGFGLEFIGTNMRLLVAAVGPGEV
jgi:PilZ domain